MRRHCLLAALPLALLAVPTAGAAPVRDTAPLAKSVGCFACHAVDHAKVGPSYAAVAARFAHDPNATAILQDAILNGHQGTWGIIPMPAYAPDGDLTPRQAHQLARWILSLR